MHRSLPLACVLLAACTDVSTVRVGNPAPPHPTTCELELIDAPAANGIPTGFELVGYVNVQQKSGLAPTDPAVLQMIKPEACKLGGEKVSTMLSGNATNGIASSSYHSFAVWHAKAAESAPKQPVKF